jgi:hypothetical protein
MRFVQAAFPDRVEIAFPAEPGHILDRLPAPMLPHKPPERLIDGRLFCGETGRGHGFGEEIVVNVYIGAHGRSDVYEISLSYTFPD